MSVIYLSGEKASQYLTATMKKWDFAPGDFAITSTVGELLRDLTPTDLTGIDEPKLTSEATLSYKDQSDSTFRQVQVRLEIRDLEGLPVFEENNYTVPLNDDSKESPAILSSDGVSVKVFSSEEPINFECFIPAECRIEPKEGEMSAGTDEVLSLWLSFTEIK
jgi:hypothetical protein